MNARANLDPGWRTREAQPATLLAGQDYHRRNCPAWGSRACDRGLCIPKYLWQAWERRQGTPIQPAWLRSLEAFVRDVVEGLGDNPPGDRVERFWPDHFEARFGRTAVQAASTPTVDRDVQQLCEAAHLRTNDIRRWFIGVRMVRGPEGIVTLIVPDELALGFIERNYVDALEAAVIAREGHRLVLERGAA